MNYHNIVFNNKIYKPSILYILKHRNEYTYIIYKVFKNTLIYNSTIHKNELNDLFENVFYVINLKETRNYKLNQLLSEI